MAAMLSLLGERRLWRFHGGLHIPDEKSLSNGRPIEAMPLPERLIIPLQQHIGAMARPVVQVGERVLKGQLLAQAEGYISACIHASSSGTLVAIEDRPVPHPSGLSAPCAIIETDGEDRWTELPETITHYAQLDPAEIRERIRWAGIVGLGGASFPTSVKLNPGADVRIRTLVINGAECEPYITCDDMLMRERAGDVLAGARIMHHLLGGPRILIGIEDNKPEAQKAMRLALAETDMRGYTEIRSIPTLYPSGGEKQLIRILTGQEVPTHAIPARIGIVCQNVASAAALAEAVLEGRPLISRIVTVTGRAIAEPRNLDVRIGEAPDPGPALACIRCGRCAEVCPARLLPQQLYWNARAKDLDRVQDYNLFDCIECGCCAQICPSHIPLVQYYRYAKTEIWAREQEKRKSEQARARHAAKQARLERQEQEKQARLRKQKEALEAPKPAADGEDPKKALIEAARQRAAARRSSDAAGQD
jgi:Na+-translocating ferredoxin:NAD+ oxidoreductase subunit C